MNVTKNGIPRDSRRNHVDLGKPYRSTANPHNNYITLFRVEDFTPVWLVMPFDKNEVDQQIREGWKIVELWVKKQ